MITMKKLIAVILAMVLALSVSSIAFAEDATVGTLTCPVCGKIYINSTAGAEQYNKCLDGHRDAEGYFVCQTCGKKYEDPQSYVACLKQHLEKGDFVCATCGAKFYSQDAYNSHVATHFNNTDYRWTQYVNLTLPELMDKFFSYLQASGVLQVLTDLFYDLYNLIMNGITSARDAEDVAGAADRLDSALDGLGIDNGIIAGIREFINAVRQKIKNFYASFVETVPATETEAPVDTGSATAGIAAFAVITAAAAAAYVVSSKKKA